MFTASRTIPLLDLRAQDQAIRAEILAEVTRPIDSQKFILGEEVAELEHRIAAYCQTPYAIGCASGTDALELALMALDIGRGNEVITVPYTFFATAGAIARVGARPVFVDVDEETCQLDVNHVEKVLDRHPQVKAILPLHLQKCFAYLGYRPGDFPASENLARESLALPVYAELADEDLEAVFRAISQFFGA